MFAPGAVRVAAVPTAWCNDDVAGLDVGATHERVLSEMALAGYAGTELGGCHPDDPPALGRDLERRGLVASGAALPTWFASEGGTYERSLATFRAKVPSWEALGVRDVVVLELTGAVHRQPVPVLANRPVFHDAQWTALVRGVGAMGRIARAHGLRLHYRPQVGSVIQDNDDVDRLMAATSPAEVSLLLDTGQITAGGGDALRLAKDHADRIGLVHVSQVREPVLVRLREAGLSFAEAIREGLLTVPGDPDGMLDLEVVLAALAGGGYQGWLAVDAPQDPAVVDPLESFRGARAWLREVAGV